MIRTALTNTLICLVAIGVFACKSRQNPVSPPSADTVDKSQIIALLQGRTTPAALETTFKQYHLTAKGQTSRSENKWIFTFDAATIAPDDLLAKVKAAPNVVEAYFPPVKKDLKQ